MCTTSSGTEPEAEKVARLTVHLVEKSRTRTLHEIADKNTAA